MYRYLPFLVVSDWFGFFDIHQAKPQSLTVMLDVPPHQEISNGRTHEGTDPEKTWVSNSLIATYLRGPLVRSHSIFDGTIHVMLDVRVMLESKNDGFPNAGISFSSGLFSGADC